MKVKRYTQGASNVSELTAQRQAALSPQESAAAAYKPYETVGEIAGVASGALVEYQQNKIIAENADDTATAELNFSIAEAKRKATIDQAKAENWGDVQFQETMDAITTEALGTVDQISPRNQDNYQKALTNRASIWQYQTASQVNVMKFNQSIVKTDASVELAVQGLANPETRAASVALANNQINAAVDDGRYSRATADQKLQVVSDVHLGYEMADQYKAAVEAGKDADYMASMADETFSADTLNTFFAEKKLYDAEVGAKKAEENAAEQLKLERAFTNVQQDIIWRPIETPEDLKAFATSYSNDALNNYADANKLSLGNRSKLFTARNARLKELASRGNKKSGGTLEPDLSSKEYRKDIDNRGIAALGIDSENYTPQQRDALVDWEIINAPDLAAWGQTTTNYMNNSATGGVHGTTEKGWEQFLAALPKYEKMSGMDNVVWDGFDAKAREMYETVRYMNYENNPDLARQIWVNYRSASPSELSMAQEQYVPEDLYEAIESDETRANSAGIIREDNWLWVNKVADMPNSTKAQLDRVAKSMATMQAITNGTVNYQMLADTVAGVMGTMVTTSTLNKGAPSGTDTLSRIDAEVMLYPPVQKDGEKTARIILEQDFIPVGKEPLKVKVFNREYTIVAPYEITMDSLEARAFMSEPTLGSGIAETLPDPYADIPGDVIPVNMIQIVTAPLRQNQFNEKGERVWNLYYRGKPLLNPDNSFIEWTPIGDTEGRLRQMEEEANATVQ